MDLHYQGLTNSMSCVNNATEVDINKAYNKYMPTDVNLKAELKYFINMEDKEEALEMLKFRLQNFCDMYYTLFDAYGEYKAI